MRKQNMISRTGIATLVLAMGASLMTLVTPAGALQRSTVGLVKDIASDPAPASSEPANLLNVNGTVFFQANDGVNGIELWKTDGTAAGTVQVKDVNPGPDGSNPANLTNVGGVLYFTANDPEATGNELWKSDGTEEGTVLVADIDPTPSSIIVDPVFGEILVPAGSSNPSGLTVFNGQLYFSATEPTAGAELWKTDGTEPGTVRVADIIPGAGGSSPGLLTVLNGVLYFRATDGTVAPGAGTELWKTNGTAAGTSRVADINPGTANSSLSAMVVFNGALFFAASNGNVAPNGFGTELWTSNGTADGTVLVKDIRTGTSGSNPNRLVVSGGILYFLANNGTVAPAVGEELWKSDGTAAGTVLVKDVRPGPSGSFSINLTDVNGTLFWAAVDGTNGPELWKSDGTLAGTVLVKDINPGTLPAFPASMTNIDGILYFQADGGAANGGIEPWISDGTTAGTVRLADINPGTANSGPDFFTKLGDIVLFSAADPTHGKELFGTGAVTNPFPGPRRIQSVATGLYAEVNGGSTAEGALIIQNPLVANDRQRWTLEPTGNGDYVLRNILTNKVAQASNRTPAPLTTVTYTGTGAQRWRVEARDGSWKIINSGSGKCADLFQASAGANVSVRRCASVTGQLWNLPPD